MAREYRNARAVSGSRRVFLIYFAGETGSGEPPTAAGARVGARRAEGDEPNFRNAVRQGRPPVDPAGAIVERAAAPGFLRHPLGAAADRAARLQPSLPLVRGAFAGRSGVGPDNVHQEPGPVAARRRVPEVHD